MRAILICPGEDLRKEFEQAIAPHWALHISRTLDEYPTPQDLRRVVRAWAPEIVFLNIENLHMAELIARQLEAEFPAIQRVALHPSQDVTILRQVLQLRMTQLLSSPFESTEVGQVLDQLERDLEIRPVVIDSTDRFFAFMPAKAGVGASTIAANTTWAFSQMENTSVLLADFDMASGVTEFMFNTSHDRNLADATAHGRQLDDDAWRSLIKTVGNTDLLLSGAPRVGEGIPRVQVSQLIEFARRNYNVVSADVPDTFDETTLAVLREANKIMLVTTPELSALRLAHLKVLLLRKLDLLDKVSLLLNRESGHMLLNLAEIEKTVGLPVFMSFPCDYADVTEAIRAGRPAATLATSVQKFARMLLDRQMAAEKPRRFIERFGLVPLRYGFR
jgi:Flp pilus assembly CpaE family ATPase